MKSIFKNTLLSVCAIGVLAGCASKDANYDNNINYQDSVNNKLDNISGTENSVNDDNIASTNNANGASLTTVTNSGSNVLESEISGEKVLLESVHFKFDNFNLSDEMRSIATSNYGKIDNISQKYSNVKIKLEGNCDEWGTDEYNYALGLKRAKAAKDALIADGANSSSIVMVSFGESNPVCNQKNSACWKMNRRVDYRLLP